MAVIAVQTELVGRVQGEVILHTWPNLGPGDTGEPVMLEHMGDRTVQAYGTFGAGTVSFEGTLETSGAPAHFATLTDPQGNDLTFTGTPTERVEAVTELVYQIRPNASAGVTSVTAKMLMRKTIR